MSFLIRIAAAALRHSRLLLYVLGAVAAIFSLSYLKEQWVDGEVASRSIDTTVEQLTGFTDGLPDENARHQEEKTAVEQATERASREEDADDPMPESTRRLYLELWGEDGGS